MSIWFRPFMCALTSQGVSVLLSPAETMKPPAITILIEGIDREDYWQVFEQLKAWERGFSGDEDLVKGALDNEAQKLLAPSDSGGEKKRD